MGGWPECFSVRGWPCQIGGHPLQMDCTSAYAEHMIYYKFLGFNFVAYASLCLVLLKPAVFAQGKISPKQPEASK
jgi:hypothetical protein